MPQNACRSGLCIFGLSLLLMLGGCSSRAPNTVQTYAPGDSTRSCSSMLMEMGNIERDMQAKWSEKNKQTASNVALAVAGVWLVVPWFFMDFSNAEKAEWESMKRRFDHLNLLCTEKGCSPYVSTIKKEEDNTTTAKAISVEN